MCCYFGIDRAAVDGNCRTIWRRAEHRFVPSSGSDSSNNAPTTSSDASAPTTSSDASAATPDEVASPPRKKGVARLTDAQQRKEDDERKGRNAKSRANTALLAAERDAIKAKGKTAVQTKNLFM